jgi:hypothetical protein
VLDGLVEAARARQPDRRVRGAGIVDVERAQDLGEPGAQRPARQRSLRQRREQQRDPGFVLLATARREASTTARTVSPTPRSPARASSGPTAIALRSMSSNVVSWKSWLGVMLPGFSALTSSTQASCAAPATPLGVRTVAPPACAEDRRTPA